MSPDHEKCLTAWDGLPEEFDVLTFDRIAERSGVERHKVRRIVRALARKNLTKYVRGCMTEDGDVCGSGYSKVRS